MVAGIIVRGAQAVVEVTVEPAAPPGRVRVLVEHPVALTAAIGLVVATLNVWWVATHRDVGALNIDEAGYLSTALQFHRVLDPAVPGAVLDAFLEPAPTGAFVQVLSVPFLVLGPRSVQSALAMQAVIGVVAAVAAAGLVRRSPRPAPPWWQEWSCWGCRP